MKPTATSVALLLAGSALLMGWSGQVASAGPALPGAPTAKTPSPQATTVSVLYSTTASRGTLTHVKGQHLVYDVRLQGSTQALTWFTDRPFRDAGFVPTRAFVKGWRAHGFTKSPPNVALVVRTKSGATDTVVAEMSQPRFADGVLTARLRVLTMEEAQHITGHLRAHAARHDEKVPARFTNAALFIDDATGKVINDCLIGIYASCPGADLSGADLSGTDLTGMDLTGADLSGSDLSGANFTYTHMSNANFTGADAHNAYMGYANFAQADFTRANLSGTSFRAAHLDGATLVNANLTSTDIYAAMADKANFAGADLTDGSLYQTTLNGANFKGAILIRTNVSWAQLDGTDFSGTDLTGAVFNWNWLLLGAITDATTTCPDGTGGPCK